MFLDNVQKYNICTLGGSFLGGKVDGALNGQLTSI
jgi:hypothetical protein